MDGAYAVKHVVVGLKQDREIAQEVVHAVEIHNIQIPATHKVVVSFGEKSNG